METEKSGVKKREITLQFCRSMAVTVRLWWNSVYIAIEVEHLIRWVVAADCFFFWIHDATTCQVLCVARNGWLHSMCHSDISLHFICKGSNGYIRFAYRINVYNKACECVECVRGEMHLSLPLYCIYDIVLSFSLTKPKTYTHKLRELSKNVQQ